MGLASKCAVGGENQALLLPSVELHGGGSGARNARAVAPEHPVPYPDGPVKGVSFIVPALGPDSPWPRSLVRMFKAFRLADSVYLRMLRLMTPRLHAIVLRIFGAMDGLLVARKQPPTLGDLPEWNKKSGANSLRCGIMSVRHDKSAEMMTGVYANPFWTGELPCPAGVCDARCSHACAALCLEQTSRGSTRKSSQAAPSTAT
eukprot:3934547-Rhodomonas_salina.2